MNRPLGLLLALGLLVAACGGDATTGFDPNQPATGPLTALAECDGPPEAEAFPPVEGATLHPDTTITSVTDQGPLVNVTGYIPITPVNVRLWYEAQDDLELIIIEDEIFEAELLVSDGTHRTYVKASAICQTGSTMLGVVAEELDADSLPVPAGALSTTPDGS